MFNQRLAVPGSTQPAAFWRLTSHPALQRFRHSDGLIMVCLILSLAYYYIVPSPLLSLPGLIVFVALTWVRRDLALCVLPLTFPFWFVPKRVAGHEVFPLSEIALAVCAAVALIHAFLRLASAPQRSPRAILRSLERQTRLVSARVGFWLALGAILLLVGATLGVVVARRPPEALRAWRWEIAEPLLYLVLVVLNAHGRHTARYLLWAFLGSGLLVAALATAQVFWLHVTFTPLADGNRLIHYTYSGSVPRATAIIYGSGNSLGAWLERALPLALAIAFSGLPRPKRSARQPSSIAALGTLRLNAGVSPRERAVALLCAFAYLPALVWSASRGAWVGAAIACFIVVCLALRRWFLVALGLGAAAALALVKRNTLERIALLGHGGSGEVRLLVWLAALHMIRDHPIFGIGPDQFLYYYSNRYTNHPYWITHQNGHLTPAVYEPTLAQPHNLILDLWLSGGILALVGGFAILGNFWLRCLSLWWRDRGLTWRAAASLGVGASMLAAILHGMVDNAYFAPDLALAFWWSIALLITLERQRA